MIMLGVICEINASKSLVCVDYQGTTTGFIPYMATANTFKQHFIPPRVGEQVLLMKCDSGDTKIALGGIFSTSYKEPNGSSQTKEITKYEDGTQISYDTSTSTLEITSPKIVNITTQNAINITTPTLNLSGDLKVSGIITDVKGDLTNHKHNDSDGAVSLPR